MFDKDFIFGAATASFQIEGATNIDGRTPSIWDTHCQKEGNIYDSSNGDIACESYLRYKEDVKLLKKLGVKTIICTDISKDGAMKGANHELYRDLAEKFDMRIVASGGVSTIDDIQKLRELDIYGAIVGKAYYTGAINLREAIEVAK